MNNKFVPLTAFGVFSGIAGWTIGTSFARAPEEASLWIIAGLAAGFVGAFIGLMFVKKTR